MTWIDAAAVLALAAVVAVAVGVYHPVSRPWVVATGRALWWVGAIAAALLGVLILGRRRGRDDDGPASPAAPPRVDHHRGYVRRVDADREHAARTREADEADTLAELQRMEDDARARVGLPPIRRP